MKIQHYRVWVENTDLFPHDGLCGGSRCEVCGCCLHCFHECGCTDCSCSSLNGIQASAPVLHTYLDETEAES